MPIMAFPLRSQTCTAVNAGGVITFNCGSAATTIKLTQTLVAPSTLDTVIEGHDLITLDGGGTTRLFHFDSPNYRATRTTVTLQGATGIQGDIGPQGPYTLCQGSCRILH